MTMWVKRNVEKVQETAAVQEMPNLQKEAGTAAVKQTQDAEKTLRSARRKTRKKTGNRKHAFAAMIRSAADPKNRAVMSRVWTRRRKRLNHLSAALRLVIRYLNARDSVTIFRNR